MKKWIVLVAGLLLTSCWTAELLAASVQGYTRKDGTYVAPYQRTLPDANPLQQLRIPREL
jgi:hypothetical protein